jgi:cell division ATPase FtsA
MREFVSTMIGRSVRLGRPAGVIGLAEATATSAFASPVGLIHYSYIRQHIELAQTDALISGRSGRISQIGNWFKYYIWDGGSR